MRERDQSSRTLTAAEVIRQLQKVPPDTPVVMAQNDEPLSGAYGVRSIEVTDMKRDRTYADGNWGTDVWHEASWLNEFPNSNSHRTFDPPRQVVFLGDESPYRPTVDGEIAPKELS